MTDPERMQELLTYANYAKVGRALGVSKTTVSKWAKGDDVNPRRLRQVEDLLRPLPAEQVPQWVERLMMGIMALEGRAGVSDADLAKAQARAAAALAVVPQTPPRPKGDGARSTTAA